RSAEGRNEYRPILIGPGGCPPCVHVSRGVALGNAQPRLPDAERPCPGDRCLALGGQPVARGQGRRAETRRDAAAHAARGAATRLLSETHAASSRGRSLTITEVAPVPE